MKVKAEVLKTELQTQRKKLYSAKKSIKLLKLKVNSLKDVVNNLRRQNLMSSHALDHLESSIGDMPKALMARMMKRVRTKSLTKEKYPEELRKFAITLHFYSAKAYEYVRKSFNLSLPHQSTIRKWSSGIESLPGFSSICFEALKQKVDEAKSCNNIVVCSLLIDEMAIKKQIDFDGNRFWGYVDIGGEIEDDQVELAQEAFVVMAVCMNSSWKLPLGYFLIKSLTGAEKANIVQEAIIRLHDIGIDVPSVTCDGPAAHFAMFRELGCDFSNVHNLKTYFNHPVNKETKVYALFDICHMLKLTRNALAMNQILQDSEGGQIKWDYIKKLHEKQDKETLSLANKLKKKHIDWTKQKMKVNLAAQTLSNSVAESLKFLCNDLNLQEFQGCEATVNFIKIVDQAFDIMNSRLPWKMGFKGPLRLSNETKWRPFIEDTINYFLNIKDIGGKYLWETPRKTPVLGFAISLTSILGIFDDYVKSGKMKYILTYKVSQDHLELFFCAARTRNGWNNNPSALQFMRSFKKLILHANIADNGDLSKNRFCELPDEILGFHFLEKLHCYHNSIRLVPDAVNNLQCLSFLDLSRNQLSTLPRELCQLPIQILLVSNNNLTALPDELCRMSSLTELDASCNRLTHLPPRLHELRALRSLALRSNLLLAVPVELTQLALARLDVRANRIGCLPVEMRAMAALIELLVEDNPLTSPPASLCKRGRVHIFKYLELESMKYDGRGTESGTGTLGRRSRRSAGGSSPGPLHLSDRLKHKRQNVDSGYSTSSDYFEKRWSQEMNAKTIDQNGTQSTLSTPSTISPAPDCNSEEDLTKTSNDSDELDKLLDCRNKEYISARLSPCSDMLSNSNGIEDKKPLHQIQTYREYKEALKQQRAQDVPSIYRTKDDQNQNYKTEPNTPTHNMSPSQTLATSKSDPNPLNSHAFTVYDETAKKLVQKVPPTRAYSPSLSTHANGVNGSAKISNYVKPKSPVKGSSEIMSHDNVPALRTVITNGKTSSLKGYASSTPKGSGAVKTPRNISWNHDVPNEKLSFTMRREIDKAKEETDLINQLRNIIEAKLKMVLPEDLASSLTDGVVLCHLANYIRPRSVASIHVPSPAVPKLTMARCRRNVDNFIEACRKIGVDEDRLCSSFDVTEALCGRGLPRLVETVECLCRLEIKEKAIGRPQKPASGRTLQDTTVSFLLLGVFFGTVWLLFLFPPSN